MVKRRTIKTPKNQSQEPTEAQIREFAMAADGGSKQTDKSLNPNAKRNYKSITVHFNEHEFRQLEKLANQTGRSKLNAIRWSISQMCEQ